MKQCIAFYDRSHCFRKYDMQECKNVIYKVLYIHSFFLEKNMLSFFLRIMKQKCGSYVCVQLLQTLNILFENIRNETSLCEFNEINAYDTTVNSLIS